MKKIWAIAAIANIVLLLYYYPALPMTIGTKFNLHEQAIGFMTKKIYLTFNLLVALTLNVVFFASTKFSANDKYWT